MNNTVLFLATITTIYYLGTCKFIPQTIGIPIGYSSIVWFYSFIISIFYLKYVISSFYNISSDVHQRSHISPFLFNFLLLDGYFFLMISNYCILLKVLIMLKMIWITSMFVPFFLLSWLFFLFRVIFKICNNF